MYDIYVIYVIHVFIHIKKLQNEVTKVVSLWGLGSANQNTPKLWAIPNQLSQADNLTKRDSALKTTGFWGPQISAP